MKDMLASTKTLTERSDGTWDEKRKPRYETTELTSPLRWSRTPGRRTSSVANRDVKDWKCNTGRAGRDQNLRFRLVIGRLTMDSGLPKQRSVLTRISPRLPNPTARSRFQLCLHWQFGACNWHRNNGFQCCKQRAVATFGFTGTGPAGAFWGSRTDRRYPECRFVCRCRGLAQEHASTRRGSGVYQLRQPVLTGNGAPVRLSSLRVSHGYFGVLKARPALGVVVLSYQFWRERFRSDPKLIGQRILLNGRPQKVVGIPSRDLKSLPFLFQVSSTDLESFLAISVGVLVIAVAASFFPARRASRITPLEALKHE